MSTTEILQQIRTLTPEQQREIIGKIHEEFGDFEPVMTPAQSKELDWRLAEHGARPDEVTPWSQIKAEAETKYSRKS